MFRKALICFLLIFVVCCANQTANKNYKFTDKNKHKGLAVFSITQTGDMDSMLGTPHNQSYYFKRIDNPKENKLLGSIKADLITFSKGNSKNAEFPGVAGELKMFELEPGDYKFFSYGINTTMSIISWDYFEYHFSVTSGEISYLGNLNADIKIRNKNFLSDFSPLNFHADIKVKDEYVRDIEVFRKKFKNLAEYEVLNSYNALSFGVKTSNLLGK